jgi:RHS repeat-associated protein
MKRILIYKIAFSAVVLLGSIAALAQAPPPPPVDNEIVPAQYISVKKEIIKKKGITSEASFAALTPDEKIGVINYFDGLGRQLATAGVRGSGNLQDMFMLYAYDNLGRVDTVFLPFVKPTTTGAFTRRGAMVKDQKAYYVAGSDKVVDDAKPFGVTKYEASSFTYVTEQGAPGTAWQPGSNTIRTTFSLNSSAEVRRWKADLTSPAFYAANLVVINELTDENGNLVKTFFDKAGRLLEKHVQVSVTEWLKTLYIHDDRGYLRYIIQPEGVKQLGSSTTISPGLLDKYGFQFLYDDYGRLVEKKVPSAAVVYFCYDPLGRLALMQDGNLRAQSKWSYVKYDRLGRSVMQGLYTNTTQTTRISMQANVLDALNYFTGETFYEKKVNGGSHGYTNQSFPTSNTEVLMVNYFDDYDLNADNSPDAGYQLQSLSLTTPEGVVTEGTQFKTVGRITASKKLILGTSTWLTTFLFYDQYGNLIQVQKNNHKRQQTDNVITSLYDFTGKVRLSKNSHTVDGTTFTTVLSRYEYDHMGRTKRIFQKNNGDPETLLVTYNYNSLGQLVDKSLSGADDSYLQSVDYRYHIRGWLSSINNAQLDANSDTNDEVNDLFGMEFLYETTDAGLSNTALYNGNFSAIKWKTYLDGVSATSDRKSFTYSYDKSDRLTTAAYKGYKENVSNWTAEVDAFNEQIAYDHNGNITALVRKKPIKGAAAFSIAAGTMDDLAYSTYDGNKLVKVEDSSTDDAGFKNGSTAATEYTYDANGNILSDLNKGISSIVYNVLDKPVTINFSDGRKIEYTYDAEGNKLTMKNYQGVTLQLTTDYIDGFFYENNTLKFFGSPEGRVVKNGSVLEYQFALTDHQGNTRALYGKPFETSNLVTTANPDCTSTTGFTASGSVTVTAVTNNGETYVKALCNQSTGTPGLWPIGGTLTVQSGEKYTFKVKGYGSSSNTRIYVWGNNGDIIAAGKSLPVSADNEDWISNDFVVPFGTTQVKIGVLWDSPVSGDTYHLNKIGVYKHADDDAVAGFETASQASEASQFLKYNTNNTLGASMYARTGAKSYVLNGSTQLTDQVIGLSKSIQVFPGDVVNMEVYAKYLTTTGSGTGITGAGALATALRTAFNLTPGGGTDAAYQAIGNLFNAGPIIGTPNYPYEDTDPPKAYINYILFDEKHVPYDFGYDQIDEGGYPSVHRMSLTARVRKPGFIYIYLSNESEYAQEVYFDDLAIKHVKSPLIQSSEYYAFGLQTAQSWTRTNATGNSFLYNMGSELNGTSGWYETFFRGYDPALGRFLQVDPLATKYSGVTPYQYAFNNPILWNDPTGLDPSFVEFLQDLFNNTKGNKRYTGVEVRQMFADWSNGGGGSDGGGVAWDGYGAALQITPGNGGYSQEWVDSGIDPKTGLTEFVVHSKWVTVDQQGFETPDEIKRRFGESFFKQYFLPLTSTVFKTQMEDADVKKHIRERTEFLSKRILADADGIYNMRAIYYEIQTGDSSGWVDHSKTFVKNIIDPSEWTMDRIWGNPGALRSDGTVGAFQYNADSGTVFYLIVHFQRIPTNM